jgi:hypothetical protein
MLIIPRFRGSLAAEPEYSREARMKEAEKLPKGLNVWRRSMAAAGMKDRVFFGREDLRDNRSQY